MHLSQKLQKYINRVAATCMGTQYAHRYMREYKLRNRKKAGSRFKADAQLAAQAELLGQIGFKATLHKMRYTDQKPPPTP